MTLPAQIIATTRADGREVLHLGTLFDGAKPVVLPAYNYKDVDVPSHGWLQQWTTPRPITPKRSPAQIIAAKRMFPFGNTGCKVDAPPARIPFTKPMDSSGITKYFPSTGERRDIGLVTDPSAYFMLGGSPDDMIDWALAAGSCPMHFRDETTGRPVDLLKYPGANCYQGNQGPPRFDIGVPNPADNGYQAWAGGWTPQQAHYCEMSYLAHMATLDTGFLEDLCFSANFTVLADATISGARKIATVYGELRGISWAFRNLFMAHAATLDAEAAGTLPAQCHPSSYWKTLLDNQLAYYTATYKNDPKNDYYRLLSGGTRFAPWQVDYSLSALGFGVLTGHSEWIPLYLWCLKNVIDRTSGKSGYPVGWGGAYYLNTCEWGKNADGTYNQGVYDTTKPLDWYGSFLFIQNDPSGDKLTPAQIAKLKTDPFNGGKAITGGEYLMTTRAVLVQAQYLDALFHASGGVDGCDVKSVYPDLDLCFTNVDRMVRAGGNINPRQSYVLDPSQAPTTIPPITPPTNPPTEISMSDTKLAVGETKHITLTVTPTDADQTGLAYTATPDGLVTLAPDASGVAVTRIARGTATIEADLNGHKATAEALDTIPLADAIALSWDS